jgi:hypothetical protein
MKSKQKIALIIILALSCVHGKLRPPRKRDLVVPKFITSVIRECSEREATRNHDVAIVQIEVREKSGTADEIAEMVMREVPSSTVLIHQTFDPIEGNRLPAASFVVIVANLDDPVS